jgi:hypothetical protein
MTLNEEILRIKEVMMITEKLSLQGGNEIFLEQRISDLPQNQQQGPKPQFTQAKPGQQTYGEYKKTAPLYKRDPNADNLIDAVDYIKKNGIGAIIESLRGALISAGGVTVQTVLAFTGVGAIANDIAWGILTLYDAYQYFVNNGGGKYIINLIIDLICLATAGTLGTVLGKFFGKAATSIGNGVKILMEGGVGKAIKPIINTIKSGAAIVSKWLGQASTFMKNNMGINWASGVIEKVNSFFTTLVTELGEFIGGGVAATAGLVKRAGVNLSSKYAPSVAQGFESISTEQVKTWTSKLVTQSQLKAAQKTAEEALRDKPTQEVLNLIDTQYGTHIGDAFALYLNSKKMSNLSPSDLTNPTKVVADLSQGKNPIDKRETYAGKIEKSAENLGVK